MSSLCYTSPILKGELNIMNNYSTYALGFLCGLIAVILVTLLLRFIFRKKAAFSGNQYDERQRAVQGVGYKYGFLALLVTLVAGAVAEQLLGRSVMSLITFAILCMWVGLCAYIGYCIRFDAYIALNAKRKPLLIVFLAADAFNLLIFILDALKDGLMTADGMLSASFGNLITALALTILSVMLICKEIGERKSEGDA